MSGAAPQVAVAIDDDLMILTLDRPARLNAFTATMMRELIAAFDRADADDAIRAVVVTGAGERAFCAGVDLGDGAATFDYDNASPWTDAGSPRLADGTINWDHPGVRDGGGLLTLRIFESRKPVIGAINGAAVGIGATMVLPMDAILAADTARFGFAFTRRGIVPEAASSWFLPRRIGIATALDWAMSGRMVDAAEACDAGLVREVVSAGSLLDDAKRYARALTAGTAPISVAMTRAMLWRMAGAPSPMDAHRLDSQLMWQRGGSADAAEGISAFLEKRPPVFADSVSAGFTEVPPALRTLRWPGGDGPPPG